MQKEISENQIEGGISLSLKTSLYPLESIYSAAYMFLDKAYFIFDGDPEKTVEITMYPKEGSDIKTVKLEFFNEMLNYINYYKKLDKNKDISKMIIEKALFNANPGLMDEAQEREVEELLRELEKEGDTELKEAMKEIEHDHKTE